MAGSVNTVILVGNLGRDPEIRSTQSGERVATLNLATSESWRDKAGERKERTEWHKVVLWNERLVEVVEKYLKKGAKVYVQGQLQTRKYTDRDGTERYSTEIVLSRFKGELTMLDSPARNEDTEPAPRRSGGSARDELDDEIPFLSMGLERDIILPQNRKPRGARL